MGRGGALWMKIDQNEQDLFPLFTFFIDIVYILMVSLYWERKNSRRFFLIISLRPEWDKSNRANVTARPIKVTLGRFRTWSFHYHQSYNRTRLWKVYVKVSANRNIDHGGKVHRLVPPHPPFLSLFLWWQHPKRTMARITDGLPSSSIHSFSVLRRLRPAPDCNHS